MLTNQTKNNSPKIHCGTEEVHKNAPETMLERLKEIFIASFLIAYNGLDPQNDLGLAQGDSTEQFLNSACTATLNNWRNSASQKLYAAINPANQVIEGFIVLDRSNPEQVYIAQMAIAPETQGRGLGKKLVALADNFSPQAENIHLITRRINNSAISFYRKLGFAESDKVPDGYDPARYQAFKRPVVNFEGFRF